MVMEFTFTTLEIASNYIGFITETTVFGGNPKG